MTIPLRHGVFLAPFHSLHENPTLAMERDLQLCQLLDELGFHEAWIGEHHSGGLETIDAPEVFIAAAAERTKHIRFGTGVVSLPYHHPLHVANRIIQLDHMTRGRVMFGAGPGLLASDALMMGIEPEDTRRRMEEGIDVILRLFRGEFVTEQTDWYTMRDAAHAPPALHRPAPRGLRRERGHTFGRPRRREVRPRHAVRRRRRAGRVRRAGRPTGRWRATSPPSTVARWTAVACAAS